MQLLKHVNYNFQSMQKPFLTGLRLKNNLSSQLVLNFRCSKSSKVAVVETLNGIHAAPLSIPAVTWDMLGIDFFTQKLHLQRHDSESHERLLWL